MSNIPHRKNIIGMSIANSIALLMSIFAYVIYSRILSTSDYALYAAALLISKFGTLILDGGVKTTIINEKNEINLEVRNSIFRLALFLGFLIIIVVGIFCWISVTVLELGFNGMTVLFAYASSYMLTYPFILIPSAMLERRQSFESVYISESIGVTIEYVLPALMWILVMPTLWAFVISAWIGRMVRVVILIKMEWIEYKFIKSKSDIIGAIKIIKEGCYLQFGLALSLIRDNMHFIIIGPLFGDGWIAYYTWAMQMCAIASQVFIQTAMRIALPVLRVTDLYEDKLNKIMLQLKWLAIFIVPLLIFLQEISDILNNLIFKEKWANALALIPFFSARMVPGLITTTFGSLLLVERGSKLLFKYNLFWTIFELISAFAMVYLFGIMGLAMSYSIAAWMAVIIIFIYLPGKFNLYDVLRTIFMRGSILAALIYYAIYKYIFNIVVVDDYIKCVIIIALYLVSVFSEKSVREVVLNIKYRRSNLN